METDKSAADRGAKPRTGASEPANPPQKAILRDYIETILVCVIFVIFSRAFVFQQSKIPSGSMMDTLLIGDYIMVNRFVFAPKSFDWESRIFPIRELRRGDVVVFKQPQEPEIDYIKRVIGLPGDTVEIRDGYLYTNNERVDEPYVQDHYRRALYPRQANVENYHKIKVKPGHYFVMGDHRNSSADSRSWGLVSRDLIKGRALLIWWSYEEEPGNTYMPAGQRLKSWGSKILHFPTRSRWERCFDLIR